MDFDAKYKEKFSSSNNLPSFFNDNYSKNRDDNQFSLEGVLSSKNTSNNFLFQDYFQPLETINLNNGSSSSTSNVMLPIVQTNFLDSFENTTFGCLPTYDLYETKPSFGNHATNNNNSGVLVPHLMENFNQSGVDVGVGVGILGHSHQMMNNPINMISPNSQSYNPFSYCEFVPTKFRPLDEDSCTTPRNDATMVSNNFSTTTTTTMTRRGGRGRKKKTNVVKGQWTIEEDRLLMQLVERHGIRKWSQIAQLLNGRIGKQCRERWHNHLRPDIKKDIWSEEEDRILIKAHAEIGNKWAEIAKKLPGRTENSIKNHWNATKRRQFSKRKCRSKFPRQSSLLQEYIKSLTPETINAGCRKKPPLTPLQTTTNNTSNNNELTISSNSSSSDQLGAEFEFSEVPDFNFDAQIFEESSIDSLLDYAPNDLDNIGYDDDHQQQGQCSFEIMDMNDDQMIEESQMNQSEVKRELDLVEMINQVNLQL
ncbi:Transcription factor MYB98 [Bienertia sinuspersici]